MTHLLDDAKDPISQRKQHGFLVRHVLTQALDQVGGVGLNLICWSIVTVR